MTANTAPIYTLTPNVGFIPSITAVNTATDGTGTVNLTFTAGANGSFLQRIRFRALGTNIATVARVFINNGAANTTATNNTLWDEITLAATTSTAVAALATYELPMNIVLNAGYRIYVVLGTAVSAGYSFTAIGGDY